MDEENIGYVMVAVVVGIIGFFLGGVIESETDISGYKQELGQVICNAQTNTTNIYKYRGMEREDGELVMVNCKKESVEDYDGIKVRVIE